MTQAAQRRPNTDARGNNYSGERVNYDARTGDTFRIGETVYRVLDTYPRGVRVERQTEHGPDVTEFWYYKLLELGASYYHT